MYEPTTATETGVAAKPATPAGSTAPLTASLAGAPTAEPFNQQPDAELKGLTALGIVVEELSSQAVACGLNKDTFEAALSKRLSDAGFNVRRNADEDTYVYISVMTTSVSAGL